MNNNINLITQRRERQHEYSKIFLITSILFAIIFTIALSLTLYSFFLKGKAAGLSRDVARVKTKVAGFAQKKEKILAISERLDSTRSIISKRNNLSDRTSQILAAIPETFNIESIKTADNVITVKLGSSSLLLLDDFLEARLPTFAKNAGAALKKIESTSFTRVGDYYIDLTFYF